MYIITCHDHKIPVDLKYVAATGDIASNDPIRWTVQQKVENFLDGSIWRGCGKYDRAKHAINFSLMYSVPNFQNGLSDNSWGTVQSSPCYFCIMVFKSMQCSDNLLAEYGALFSTIWPTMGNVTSYVAWAEEAMRAMFNLTSLSSSGGSRVCTFFACVTGLVGTTEGYLIGLLDDGSDAFSEPSVLWSPYQCPYFRQRMH